jgi:hypothetical protein
VDGRLSRRPAAAGRRDEDESRRLRGRDRLRSAGALRQQRRGGDGLRTADRGATFGGLEPLLIPGGFSEITLEVAEPDFQRAQELYDAFFAEPPPQAVAEAEEAADEDGR